MRKNGRWTDYKKLTPIEAHLWLISSFLYWFSFEFKNPFSEKFAQSKTATFDRNRRIFPISRPLRNHYIGVKWCVKVRARRSFSRSERIFGCHNHVAIFFQRPYNYGEQPTQNKKLTFTETPKKIGVMQKNETYKGKKIWSWIKNER